MRRRSGFTLVEMLIVLVIIAALVGTITPITLNAVRKANVTAANMNMQAVKSALLQYSIMTNKGTVAELSDASTGLGSGHDAVTKLVSEHYLSEDDPNISIVWNSTGNTGTIEYSDTALCR